MTRVIPALGGRDRSPQSKLTKKTRQWGTLVSRNPPSMNEVEERWRRIPASASGSHTCTHTSSHTTPAHTCTYSYIKHACTHENNSRGAGEIAEQSRPET